MKAIAARLPVNLVVKLKDASLELEQDYNRYSYLSLTYLANRLYQLENSSLNSKILFQIDQVRLVKYEPFDEELAGLQDCEANLFYRASCSLLRSIAVAMVDSELKHRNLKPIGVGDLDCLQQRVQHKQDPTVHQCLAFYRAQIASRSESTEVSSIPTETAESFNEDSWITGSILLAVAFSLAIIPLAAVFSIPHRLYQKMFHKLGDNQTLSTTVTFPTTETLATNGSSYLTFLRSPLIFIPFVLGAIVALSILNLYVQQRKTYKPLNSKA